MEPSAPEFLREKPETHRPSSWRMRGRTQKPCPVVLHGAQVSGPYLRIGEGGGMEWIHLARIRWMKLPSFSTSTAVKRPDCSMRARSVHLPLPSTSSSTSSSIIIPGAMLNQLDNLRLLIICICEHIQSISSSPNNLFIYLLLQPLGWYKILLYSTSTTSVYRQKGNPAKRHQLPFWQSLFFYCQKGNHSLSKRQPLKNRLYCWCMESLACYIVMDWVKMTFTILVSDVSQEWTHTSWACDEFQLRLMTTFGYINILQPCNIFSPTTVQQYLNEYL